MDRGVFDFEYCVETLVELVDDTGLLVDTVLSPMLSPLPVLQARARDVFNRRLEDNPDWLFVNLARVVRDYYQDTGIRTLAAHLLKLHLVQPQNTPIPVYGDVYFMWDRITRETRDSIKSILLSCVQQQTTERCLMLKLKLCAIISSLASRDILDWPELDSFIRTGLSSASPSEAALLISAESPMFVLRRLDVRGLPPIKDVCSQLLANDSLTPDLKMATLTASITFISCLSSPEDKSIFQDLVAPIMKMTMAVMGEDETNGQEVLGLLKGMDPNFLMKEQGPSWLVLRSVLDIAENDTLEEGTRHLAIHLMTNLVESAPAKISYMAPFIERFLSLGLKMMSDIEDEPGLYTLTTSDESSNYFVGKQCFAQFATAVDAYSVFPIAFIHIKDYLNAPGWESKHAALVALAQISNGCSEVMTDNIKRVVFMAINAVQNDHLRVRWAAANAVCHLAEYCFSFQAEDRQQVQTALASLMEDQCFPRIQEWAADIHRRFI